MNNKLDPNGGDAPPPEEPADGAEAQASEPQRLEPEQQADAPRSAGRWVAWLALLGVLGVVAGAVYWVEVVQPRQHHALEAKLAEVESGLAQRRAAGDELRAAVETAKAQSSKSLDSVQADLQAVQDRQKDLLAALDRLRDERAPGRGVWELREVEQLLLVAGQRLTLQRDAATALAALETADRRLQELADPSWNALRRQLASEMNALRAVEDPDLTGMALYLADQLQRVDELPLHEGDALDASTREETIAQDPPQQWRQVLGGIWQDLRRMVIVKDRKVPDYVAFDPRLRYLLQHSLRLELANARLAVLNRDSGNLRASAERIQQMLADYFDGDAAAVEELSGRLEEFSRIELRPELPDISGSLRLLRERRPSLPPNEPAA